MKKKLIIVLFILLVILSVSGIVNKGNKTTKPFIESAEQMNSSDFTIGILPGTAAMFVADEKYKKAKKQNFNSISDAVTAVLYGKVDGLIFDKQILEYNAINIPELALLPEKIADEYISIGAPFKNEVLIKKVNTFIKNYRKDGTYDEMYKRWITGKNPKLPIIETPKNPSMKIVVATEGLAEPMNFFLSDGTLTGFDIEFIKRLALFLNADVKLTSMNFAGLIPGTTTGKIDLLVANLNKTPAIADSMLFSNPYIDSSISMLVRKDRLQKNIFEEINHVDQLKGEKVGVISGSLFGNFLKMGVPEAIPEDYNSYPDQIQGLKSGKVTAFLADEPIARMVVKENPEFKILPEVIIDDKYGLVFAKKNSKLCDEFDKILTRFEKDGTIKELDNIWFGDNEDAKLIRNYPKIGKNGTIKHAINSGTPPFSYIKNGKIVGFEVDVVARIANELGYGVEVFDMDFSSLIPSVVSGKNDIASGAISITDERKKSVLFPRSHYKGGIVAIVKTKSAPPENNAFISDFKKSFMRTFVEEGRYKLIVSGLLVTLIVTFFSIFWGTILAGGICALRCSKNKVLSSIGKIYIQLMQGTPILVLLMIMYYIVFRQIDADPVFIAIIAFALSFAAYAAEMYRSGIDAVDKGQVEAATAMGFSKLNTFIKITFPQALRHILPVYRGEVISNLKMTSIVGYIAIQDLTKASDIIRSRTYETFFPLIVTAIIYFLLAFIITHLLVLVENKINPKYRKREIKGIEVKL